MSLTQSLFVLAHGHLLTPTPKPGLLLFLPLPFTHWAKASQTPFSQAPIFLDIPITFLSQAVHAPRNMYLSFSFVFTQTQKQALNKKAFLCLYSHTALSVYLSSLLDNLLQSV
jgi:hypothetical protein